MHMMKWLTDFLSDIGQLMTFYYLSSRLPPYPRFTRPNKAYRSVTQWQGKEMKNLLYMILGEFTASLSETTDLRPLSARNKSFAQKAILSVRYITDFILLAPYQVHTTGSIQSIKDYLGDFHQHKEVFRRFRANKAVNNLAKKATRELRSN